MVLKPSEIAPLSGALFAEVMHEAGLPKGVFNLVNGDGGRGGARMSSHPEVDMVSFTGSTRAGILVARSGAAPTVKRVAQELGGKSPKHHPALGRFRGPPWRAASRAAWQLGAELRRADAHVRAARADEEALAIAKAKAEEFVTVRSRDAATDAGPVVSGVHYEKIQAHQEGHRRRGDGW